MGSMTRIQAISPEVSPTTMAQVWDLWRSEMAQGNKLLGMAKAMREECDKAVDERGQMKQEYRERRGTLASGADQLVSDHRVGGFKIMSDAKADALWFSKRAVMYSTEAAAHLAAAAEWRAYYDQMLRA